MNYMRGAFPDKGNAAHDNCAIFYNSIEEFSAVDPDRNYNHQFSSVASEFLEVNKRALVIWKTGRRKGQRDANPKLVKYLREMTSSDWPDFRTITTSLLIVAHCDSVMDESKFLASMRQHQPVDDLVVASSLGYSKPNYTFVALYPARFLNRMAIVCRGSESAVESLVDRVGGYWIQDASVASDLGRQMFDQLCRRRVSLSAFVDGI